MNPMMKQACPRLCQTLMSLVSWYDPIPFHFCIFSIFALTLTYYDARNRCNASHELHESARSMLNFC